MLYMYDLPNILHFLLTLCRIIHVYFCNFFRTFSWFRCLFTSYLCVCCTHTYMYRCVFLLLIVCIITQLIATCSLRICSTCLFWSLLTVALCAYNVYCTCTCSFTHYPHCLTCSMLLDKLQFSVLRLKFERDVQFFCRGVYCIWIRAIFGKNGTSSRSLAWSRARLLSLRNVI